MDKVELEFASENEVDIELEVPVVDIEPVIDPIELELGGSVVQDDYEKLKNIPSINDVKLIGNKTTKDLGIEASGGIKGVEVNKSNVVDENGIAHISVPKDLGELTNNVGYVNKNSTSLEYYYTKNVIDNKINALPLGTVINIIDTFIYGKNFQDNDVYNANASNGIVDFVIQALLEALNREYFVSVNVVVTPQADGTFKVTSVDGDYSDIKHAFDIGGSIRCVCQLAGTNTNVVLNLSMIDNNYAYFSTVMKANLGAGEMKYLIALSISARNTTVQIDVLQ